MIEKSEIRRAFLSWRASSEPEIERIQELLSTKLSDNPSELLTQLTEVEAWHGRATTLLSEAATFLEQAEQEALMARDESWTDLDRKINLKAETSLERGAREMIAGLVEAIRTRLILGMSINKANTGERSYTPGHP